VTIYVFQLPAKQEDKDLGLILDSSLTWRPHIITKKNHINHKIRQMYWIIGHKSHLTTENKLLLYKTIIKPIWTYGVQLWGCAKPSNTKDLQSLQSKILRKAFNAPWYMSKKNSITTPEYHLLKMKSNGSPTTTSTNLQATPTY
jgi:hypothetical protein